MAKKRKRKDVMMMIDRTDEVRVTGPDRNLVWIDFECREGRLTVCLQTAELAQLNAKAAKQSRATRHRLAAAS